MKYEESDRVELKREMVNDLNKEIISFLNAEGGNNSPWCNLLI